MSNPLPKFPRLIRHDKSGGQVGDIWTEEEDDRPFLQVQQTNIGGPANNWKFRDAIAAEVVRRWNLVTILEETPPS
jgi:hypothetical protein